MDYMIRKVRLGDENDLAYIQTESWKAAFVDILSEEVLNRAVDMRRSVAMYKRLLDEEVGNGHILEVNGVPHCIAWWDRARDEDMPDYAELVCIHSLQGNWRKGYGTRMMETILKDMKSGGYARVMLWVFEGNHRARKFYEALGFVFSGKTKSCLETQEVCYIRDL